ncbi:MAG: hypothetical protein L0Z50_40450 [Verrucomicrobiales bacterium]|nr:hypothetical protein [Verrucomicrobiales bacterium]
MQIWNRVFLLLSILLAGLAAGCATQDPMNASERPWNAPKNWEHGLPTGLMEGR